jgi:hypothetical protein
MAQTQSCPAQPDGSAYQCFGCRAPIAVGAAVLDYGPHGYIHYPSCDSASSPSAGAAELDNSDHVAMAMGLMPSASTPPAPALTPRTAPPAAKSNMDLVAEAMGLSAEMDVNQHG